MCDDGITERFGIQEVYAMHNWPGMAEGQFSIRSGAFFAAADRVDLYQRAGRPCCKTPQYR